MYVIILLVSSVKGVSVRGSLLKVLYKYNELSRLELSTGYAMCYVRGYLYSLRRGGGGDIIASMYLFLVRRRDVDILALGERAECCGRCLDFLQVWVNPFLMESRTCSYYI